MGTVLGRGPPLFRTLSPPATSDLNSFQDMTLFLDAVGTLIGLKERPGQLYARFAEKHGIAVEAAELARHFGPAWKGAAPPDYTHAKCLEAREAVDRAWWSTIVRETFHAAGATPTAETFQACFDEIFAHYGTAAPWTIFPDTLAVLPRLRIQGYQLVVLSNFDQRLLQVMDLLELSPLVDEILYSSSLGACKPAPEAFTRALKHTGSQSETTLHVGDDPNTDGLGAAAAGLRFFHIQRPEIDLQDLESHLRESSLN